MSETGAPTRGVQIMERFTERVLDAPAWILGAVVLLTVGSALYVPRLEFDVSVENTLDPGDPDVALLKEVTSNLGSVVPTIIAYRDPDLFTPAGLARLDELVAVVAQNEYVDQIHALTTMSIVEGSPEGVSSRPLIEALPTTQAEADAIKELALGDDRIVGNIVGPQGDVAAVVATLIYIHGKDDEYSPLVVDHMRAAATEHLEGFEWHMAGLSVFYSEMLDYVARDMYLFLFLPAGLVALILFLLYRNIQGVVIPLLVVALTLLWTFGLMSVTGGKISVVSILLLPLILVIGCADAVHIVTQVNEDDAHMPGATRRQVLVKALGRVGLACFFTTITTMAGFSSLAVSSLRTVRQFGIFAAVAIGIALLLSITLVPVMLKWWHAEARSTAGTDRISTGLSAIASLNERRGGRVVAVTVLLAVVAIAGTHRIRVETGFRDQFKESSPIVASLDFVEQRLTGPELLDVYVDTDQASILEPTTLAAMDRVSQQLRGEAGIRKVDSVVDLLAETRHLLNGESSERTLPATRAEAAQYMLLLEMGSAEQLEQMISAEHDAARISVRLDAIQTSQTLAILERLRQTFAELDLPGVRFRTSGPVHIITRLVHEIIDSQIRSFGLAATLIFLMIALALRSFRLAAISMVPNLLPIAVMLGVLGWLDFPLNDTTIMTASIAIGIAVDDTIHYLVRFRLELADDPTDTAGAMRRSVAGVGRAITTTSIVLAAGFLVVCLASFKPPIYFGFLAAVTIVVALVADLFLLPVMLLAFYRRQS